MENIAFRFGPDIHCNFRQRTLEELLTDALVKYYVDTCIFLNIWKKEIGPDPKRPFWKSSEEFLTTALKAHTVMISTVVLQELNGCNANLDHILKTAIIVSLPKGTILENPDDAHLQFALAYGAALVTRDKCLLRRAKRLGISVLDP